MTPLDKAVLTAFVVVPSRFSSVHEKFCFSVRRSKRSCLGFFNLFDVRANFSELLRTLISSQDRHKNNTTIDPLDSDQLQPEIHNKKFGQFSKDQQSTSSKFVLSVLFIVVGYDTLLMKKP